MSRQEAPVTLIHPEVSVRPLGRQALTRLRAGSPGDSAKDLVTGHPGSTATHQDSMTAGAVASVAGRGEIINSWPDALAMKPLHGGQELVRRESPVWTKAPQRKSWVADCDVAADK